MWQTKIWKNIWIDRILNGEILGKEIEGYKTRHKNKDHKNIKKELGKDLFLDLQKGFLEKKFYNELITCSKRNSLSKRHNFISYYFSLKHLSKVPRC